MGRRIVHRVAGHQSDVFLLSEGLPPDRVIKTGSPMFEVLFRAGIRRVVACLPGRLMIATEQPAGGLQEPFPRAEQSAEAEPLSAHGLCVNDVDSAASMAQLLLASERVADAVAVLAPVSKRRLTGSPHSRRC
jgi:hypothetical protein